MIGCRSRQSESSTADPMYPEPPVMKIRIGSQPLAVLFNAENGRKSNIPDFFLAIVESDESVLADLEDGRVTAGRHRGRGARAVDGAR